MWQTNLDRWSGWDIAGDVVEVDVSTQQLFLSERLLAVVARVRLLAGVRENVTFEVALVQRRVRTQLTAETLLTVVCLQVNLYMSPFIGQSSVLLVLINHPTQRTAFTAIMFL